MNRKIESALVWLGPVLLLLGFCLHHLWTQWPSGRFAELVAIALAALGLAKLLQRLAGGSLATWLAAIWCLALLLFAGPIPVLATALFFLSLAALGGLLCPSQPLPLQVLLGALMSAGMIGWLLPLPLHSGWSYGVLCAGLIVWRRKHLRIQLRTTAAAWTAAVAASPGSAAFGIVALGLATTPAWLPTLQFDDLAYHLRLPWQLQQQGFYAAAPEHQVWALAPWAADILQAIPQLIAHQEARGPVNAVWIVLLGGGLWRIGGNLGVPPQARWLTVALAASLPLTAALAASMQTELLTAAALVWMAALVTQPRSAGLRFWLALAVLAGGLAELKLVALAMAAVMVIWALARHRWPSPARGLIALLVGAAIAGSSYTYGWLLAGNPLLPLFNSVFRSPYFAHQDFSDPRWQTGFHPDLIWNLTFSTHEYLEGYDGAAGFLLIGLCGVWLVALLRRETRSLAWVATLLLLLPLIPMQYVRYAYPGMVLLCVSLVAALFLTLRGRPPLVLVIALCVLNISFQANANWMLRNGALKQTIKTAGRDLPLMKRYAPQRALAVSIRDAGEEQGNVLVVGESAPFFAEFGIYGRSVSWYAPSLHTLAAEANRDDTGLAWSKLLRQQHVRHVLVDAPPAPALSHALRLLGATRRETVGETAWWSIPAAPETSQ
ncbi:hypothetical protein [Pseudoxanthomonas sp. X-1]|uniref:hypothetical protein n=1 Tax=Pseudoxanthomonas sp. X-1 TaxID=2571115 RepID=UPI00110AA5D9|nr:hypothetical protein [Pseudoxanthomonas sp. X-1]TMN19020.1 hypothetical protein FF950_12760 [Pseudoxanthomonas sp. X-1]UAY74229.1 hypothetical protein LAJ50_17440 [Pseudoxanthomonas sp. X-1]